MSAVTSLQSNGGQWIVNGAIRTPMLVGAGGHFCPVSRSINGPTNTAPVVVAQEAEFPIDSGDRAAFAIDGEAPELYFCRDLKGYGWCFRKQRHLNIGLGRLDRQSLPAATAEFVAFLTARAKISPFTGITVAGACVCRVRLLESPHRRPGCAAGRRRRGSCLSSKR